SERGYLPDSQICTINFSSQDRNLSTEGNCRARPNGASLPPMIHIMLPEQYLQMAGARLTEPQKRLMLAVLMSAVSDCQRRTAIPAQAADRRATSEALEYVASTDRKWPFSFENLCEAVGLDPGWLRRSLLGA